MQPAPTSRHRDLDTALVDYLARSGITIAYAPLDGDARWHADTRTLTLRADADPYTHLEIIRDLIDITIYAHRSRLGATPRRHLHAVPA